MGIIYGLTFIVLTAVACIQFYRVVPFCVILLAVGEIVLASLTLSLLMYGVSQIYRRY